MLSWYFVSVPSVTWSLYFWSAFDGISNYRDVYRVLNSALRPYCPVMGVYNDTWGGGGIAWVQHSWWEVQHKPFTLFFSFLAQNCSGLRTCSQCLEQPECGWCGDPSSTGKGLCMEGSYRGPMKRPAKQGQQSQQSQDMSLEPGSCPKDKGYEWAFIHCPGKGIHFLFSLLKWQSVI